MDVRCIQVEMGRSIAAEMFAPDLVKLLLRLQIKQVNVRLTFSFLRFTSTCSVMVRREVTG